MIEIRNLTKSFGGRPAIQDISFSTQKGEIFGLLGHNGAGKSTTLGILLGHVSPDAGETFVNGISVQSNRPRALAKVGAIFEQPRFYDYLSGWQNLEILVTYSAKVSRDEMLDAVETCGLTNRIHDRVGTYSQGMRQRLGLAQALLPAPELVLLDEPTNGLDPEGIAEMRELILKLNRERNLSMLFCSHLLTEVEQLCPRGAILKAGKLIFSGSWSELSSPLPRYRLELDHWDRAAGALAHFGHLVENEVLELKADCDVADLVGALVAAHVKVRAVTPLRQSLESIYLETVGTIHNTP